MEDKNVKQKEFWSGAGGDVWVDKQREMDIMLNPLGKNAINKIDFSDKLTILDIGCGCGDTSIDIAKKVPKGKVLGLDISEPMLDRARNSVNELSLKNIDFEVKDVQTDSMPSEYFDVAFSRFGVMFFEDSYEAFKNIYASIKQGGQLAFVCWQNPALNPWQSLSIGVIKEFLDLPSPCLLYTSPSPRD